MKFITKSKIVIWKITLTRTAAEYKTESHIYLKDKCNAIYIVEITAGQFLCLNILYLCKKKGRQITELSFTEFASHDAELSLM
jgi:hypothetical protein